MSALLREQSAVPQMLPNRVSQGAALKNSVVLSEFWYFFCPIQKKTRGSAEKKKLRDLHPNFELPAHRILE